MGGIEPQSTYWDSSTLGRDVFSVVARSALGTDATTTAAAPVSNLGKFLHNSLTGTAAQNLIKSYGFEFPAYAGNLSGTGVTYGTFDSSNSGVGAAQFSYKITGSSVTISGPPVVGQTLSATGSVTPVATSYSYAWSDGATSLGTAQTLVVPASAVGHTITLTVTASKTNYTAATVSAVTGTVSAVPAAAIKSLKVGQAKISGTAAKGKTLKASKGTWTAGTKFSYVWYVNGKSKGTKSTYTIPKKSKGQVITLKVTGKLTGYTTASSLSFGKVVTK